MISLWPGGSWIRSSQITERAMQDEAERIAGEISGTMQAMLLRARHHGFGMPMRCHGPANTMKALRVRGLGHGDYVYLTPLGVAVRAILQQREG